VSVRSVDAYPRKIEPPGSPAGFPGEPDSGTSIDAKEVQTHLNNLQLQVREDGADSFRVTVPTYRVDLTREID